MFVSMRKEPFRYKFKLPIPGDFRITHSDHAEVRSKLGKMELVDLSLNGARIATKYHIALNGRHIKVMLQFQFMTFHFSIPGRLVYQLKGNGVYYYGVHLETDDAIRRQIISELKLYAKKLLDEEKQQQEQPVE